MMVSKRHSWFDLIVSAIAASFITMLMVAVGAPSWVSFGTFLVAYNFYLDGPSSHA